LVGWTLSACSNSARASIMVAGEDGRLSTALPRITRSITSALLGRASRLRRASMSTTCRPIARETRPTISS
jgi:hypothetical protein